MTQPSNAVIVQKLDDLTQSNTKSHDRIEEHLRRLNASVEKNTKFRNISIGAYKMLGFILGSGGLITLLILFK